MLVVIVRIHIFDMVLQRKLLQKTADTHSNHGHSLVMMANSKFIFSQGSSLQNWGHKWSSDHRTVAPVSI